MLHGERVGADQSGGWSAALPGADRRVGAVEGGELPAVLIQLKRRPLSGVRRVAFICRCVVHVQKEVSGNKIAYTKDFATTDYAFLLPDFRRI